MTGRWQTPRRRRRRVGWEQRRKRRWQPSCQTGSDGGAALFAGGLASRPLGWIGLLLSVGFFLGCMGYARLEGRRRKLAAAASAPPAA